MMLFNLLLLLAMTKTLGFPMPSPGSQQQEYASSTISPLSISTETLEIRALIGNRKKNTANMQPNSGPQRAQPLGQKASKSGKGNFLSRIRYKFGKKTFVAPKAVLGKQGYKTSQNGEVYQQFHSGTKTLQLQALKPEPFMTGEPQINTRTKFYNNIQRGAYRIPGKVKKQAKAAEVNVKDKFSDVKYAGIRMAEAVPTGIFQKQRDKLGNMLPKQDARESKAKILPPNVYLTTNKYGFVLRRTSDLNILPIEMKNNDHQTMNEQEMQEFARTNTRY